MVVYSDDVARLPIKEEAPIRLSIACYDDPAPCNLHRSSLLSSIYAGLLTFSMPLTVQMTIIVSFPRSLGTMLKHKWFLICLFLLGGMLLLFSSSVAKQPTSAEKIRIEYYYF